MTIRNVSLPFFWRRELSVQIIHNNDQRKSEIYYHIFIGRKYCQIMMTYELSICLFGTDVAKFHVKGIYAKR